MDFRDYYATLGVAKSATEKEIKQAYRRLARKHHPDLNPGDRAAEATFKEVNEAYEVLGTPETRKKYDELGANWRQYEQVPPGAAGPWGAGAGGPGANYRTMTPEEMEALFGSGGSPFSDFFNTFFGGQAPSGAGRGRRPTGGRARRAPEVEYEVPLALEAALGGRVERLTVELPEGGTRAFEVRIPAGITDGSRLKAGDVFLRVKLLPHPRFERSGRDLTTPLTVPLTTAVLGGPVEVVTLTGTRLTLRVPPGTQPGQRLRLKGHGLPSPGAPDDRGDLFARVEVRVPTALSAEAQAHYEALRQLESK